MSWTKELADAAIQAFPMMAEILKTLGQFALPFPGGMLVGAAIEMAYCMVMRAKNIEACMELGR